jgi:hypothetical protein
MPSGLNPGRVACFETDDGRYDPHQRQNQRGYNRKITNINKHIFLKTESLSKNY